MVSVLLGLAVKAPCLGLGALGLAVKAPCLGLGGPIPALAAWTSLENENATLTLKGVHFCQGRHAWAPERVFNNENPDYYILVYECAWLVHEAGSGLGFILDSSLDRNGDMVH